MASARGVRRSPLHEHLKARGAVFGEVAGWERANWFARDGQEREYRYSFNPHFNFFPYTHSFLRAVHPVPQTHTCVDIGRDIYYCEVRPEA